MMNQTIGLSKQILFGLPVDRDVLFSDHKSIYRQRIEKQQTKLIGKISFMKPFLKEDEKIILATTGCSPMSVLEQLLTGWIIFYLKRSLFVFTNKRIIQVPTKANYSYRGSIAQILYADCQNVAMKRRTLVITYKNGKKEKFYYIAGRERKKIKALLKTISLEGEKSKSQGRINLCPRCTKELIKDEYTCPHCRLVFKDKAEGKKVSIIYPGGGYFYTGHPFLGFGDAVTELILMILVVVSLLNVLRGNESGISLLIFYGILLFFEKVITVYHSNHFINEYIPKEKEIKPLPITGK
jgi:hypothetical protein